MRTVLNVTMTFTICRLLSAEKLGGLCRDESVEGLRFYPNMFLTPPV